MRYAPGVHVMKRSLLAVAAALACAGCPARPLATPFPLTQDMIPEGGGVPIHVEFGVAEGGTPDLVDGVLAALRAAYPKATRWGPFRSEVHVRIYPTHAALEAELGRKNLDWLRAWATYDAVLLQSPLTWGGAWKDRLPDLLAHELCHVAVYQLVAKRDDWEKVDLPLWFREGMASWTANQEKRRGTPASVGKRLLDDPGLDPLFTPDVLLVHDQDLVYASAHWAFKRLIEEYGEAGVRLMLNGVARGLSFDHAFRDITGVTPRGFGEAWRLWVVAAAKDEAKAGTAGD